MIKKDTHQLDSRWLNGQLMYPGIYVLTWAKAPWGWLLLSIKESND